jgi:hypothetical protein
MISADRVTFDAAASSRMWSGRAVPGIGMMMSSLCNSQAMQSWAGVQPASSAMALKAA